MNKKRMLQILALVIVFSMMLSTAAFAMTPGHYKQLEKSVKNYEYAADYMMKNNIIKGYGGSNFGFKDCVKRGDIAVMIERAFKLSSFINEYEDAFDDDKFFADVDKDDYFYSAIFAAKRFGIAKGDGKNFNPNKMVTIEEAILLIERSIEATDNFDIEDLNLRELFDSDELDNYASRQDIALMLYKVLSNAEYDEEDDIEAEISDIVYSIDEDDELDFASSKFVNAFEQIEEEVNEDLEFVKFILPNDGTLYYEYDADEVKKTLVTEYTEYYVNDDDEKEISYITFVPDANYSGTIKINYKAYVDEDTYYLGLIKITVDGNEMLDDMNFTIKENTLLYFEKDDFKNLIDEVKFILPGAKIGTLYYDDDHDGIPESDELLAKSEVIEDDDLDYIIFEPYEDFADKTVIEYTAYVGEELYSGEINVMVQEVQFENMVLSIDKAEDEVYFDFTYKLENLAELFKDNLYGNFDYVSFELPEEGTLSIEINDKYYTVKAGTEYDIDDIDEITFETESSCKGVIFINYTAYDSNLEYDGVIKITVK